MCDFKIGDIVKSKDDLIFRISQIGYCGLAIYGNTLVHNIAVKCSDEEVKKVTFYEMLDFIKANYIALTISTEDKSNDFYTNLNILVNEAMSEDRRNYLCYEMSPEYITFYYRFTDKDKKEIFVNFDNLDFEKDYVEYKIKKEADKFTKEFEKGFKDAFKKVMVYGEETTVGDFLTKCFKKYKDYILQEEDPIDNLEIGDVFEYKDNLYYLLTKSPILSAFEFVDSKISNHIVSIDKDDYRNDYFKNHYTKYDMQDIIEEEWGIDMKEGKLENLFEKDIERLEPKEDTIFVNNKKKTTVIKWTDGSMTKATCDKEDKYDLEKGVMVAMLKKYYTVDEINNFIDKAKESQERDMNKWREKENKKVKEILSTNSNKPKKKKDDIDLDDLPF